uniref:Uncharacterized protein n=1 Tax=Nelumbo nucifera TaxID=4432 RepID=A0A822Z727_NELNU|nr:TPA_asm: hypothetical protein HUJ06_015195 [Nelumbo nucifera]
MEIVLFLQFSVSLLDDAVVQRRSSVYMHCYTAWRNRHSIFLCGFPPPAETNPKVAASVASGDGAAPRLSYPEL